MSISKLSAPETMRLLSASNFTHSHLDFKQNFPGRNPRTLAYRGGEGKGRGWEGIKGFLTTLEELQRERKGGVIGMGKEKEGRGPRQGGGILLQGLKGDRRPCPFLWQLLNYTLQYAKRCSV